MQIDRYTLEDAKVKLSYHLRMADGSFEEVPMGIFEVSEANRTAVYCRVSTDQLDFMELTKHAQTIQELDINLMLRTLDHIKVYERGVVVTVFLDGTEIEYKAEQVNLL